MWKSNILSKSIVAQIALPAWIISSIRPTTAQTFNKMHKEPMTRPTASLSYNRGHTLSIPSVQGLDDAAQTHQFIGFPVWRNVIVLDVIQAHA